MTNQLPPHLQALVARMEREEAAGKVFRLAPSATIRDVTPKGYGPKEDER